MWRLVTTWVVAVLLFVAIVLSAVVLPLESAQAAPRDRAQLEADEHKNRAFELFGKQDYAGGIAELERAHGLVPHPTFLFNIAVAYDQWPGHCADAFVAFDRFFDGCRGCEVAAAARKRHALLEERCLVSVTVESAPAGAKLFVDGRAVGEAPLTLRLRPGERSLVAAQADGRALSRTIVVVEGAAQVVRLVEPEPEPEGVVVAPSALPVEPPAGPRAMPAPEAVVIAPPAALAAPSQDGVGVSSAWALVPAGAGAVAAGVGAALGWSARQSLDAAPVDPRYVATRSDAESRAMAANVSFAIAGGLAVTALVVWLALD